MPPAPECPLRQLVLGVADGVVAVDVEAFRQIVPRRLACSGGGALTGLECLDVIGRRESAGTQELEKIREPAG